MKNLFVFVAVIMLQFCLISCSEDDFFEEEMLQPDSTEIVKDQTKACCGEVGQIPDKPDDDDDD